MESKSEREPAAIAYSLCTCTLNGILSYNTYDLIGQWHRIIKELEKATIVHEIFFTEQCNNAYWWVLLRNSTKVNLT